MPTFSPQQILRLISNYPIVPVFYHADAEHAQTIVQACYDGGLRVFEFTNRGDKALPVFTQLVSYVRQNCPEMALGIGTILTADDAETFIATGADFVVQPVTSPAVATCAEPTACPGCLPVLP